MKITNDFKQPLYSKDLLKKKVQIFPHFKQQANTVIGVIKTIYLKC